MKETTERSTKEGIVIVEEKTGVVGSSVTERPKNIKIIRSERSPPFIMWTFASRLRTPESGAQ